MLTAQHLIAHQKSKFCRLDRQFRFMDIFGGRSKLVGGYLGSSSKARFLLTKTGATNPARAAGNLLLLHQRSGLRLDVCFPSQNAPSNASGLQFFNPFSLKSELNRLSLYIHLYVLISISTLSNSNIRKNIILPTL